MSSLSVTDPLSHSNDHLKNVAEALRRSIRLLQIFKAVYKGKINPKPVSWLMNETHMSRVAVLQEGQKLVGHGVVNKAKLDGEIAYVKVSFWNQRKAAVLRLVANPK